MVFAQKPARLKAAMAEALENAEADLTPRMRHLIDTLWGEWKSVELHIEELTDKLEQIGTSGQGIVVVDAKTLETHRVVHDPAYSRRELDRARVGLLRKAGWG
jgi:hypothetical protein